MSSHPAFRPDKVERLRTSLGLGPSSNGGPGDGGAGDPAASAGEPQAGEPVASPAGSAPAGTGSASPLVDGAHRALHAARRRAGPTVKRALRRGLRPVLDRAEAYVRHRVALAMEEVTDRQRAVEAEVALTRGEMQALVPVAHHLAALSEVGPLLLEADTAAGEMRAARINTELLKAELGDVHRTLETLGRALSPDGGLGNAATRVAELREQVNAIDRRLRSVAAGRAPAGSGSPDDILPAGAEAHERASTDDGFDYRGFERRFRGDPDAVSRTLLDRYATLLADHQPVLDVGCGRGELLAALAGEGVAGQGVDLNAEMVEEARSRGVTATVDDAVAFLERAEPATFGAVVAIHVVEHLPLATLTAFLELAASRLRPGGVAVLETPNPASLIVLGNSYVLDPTHVWPLHPSLLAFLCERAGFRGIEIRYHSPATDYHLPLIEGVDEPWAATLNAGLARLNDVLFGPQEYAVVATAPSA